MTRPKRGQDRYPNDDLKWDELPDEIKTYYLTEFSKDDAALTAADQEVRDIEAKVATLKERIQRKKVALKVLGYDGPEVEGIEVTWTEKAVPA